MASSPQTAMEVHPERRGWGAFGAYALSGELPREHALALIEARIAELQARCERVGEGEPRSGLAAASEPPAELERLRAAWLAAARQVYADLQPWETVFIARHPRRPLVGDYLHHIVHDFCELHGDRVYGDDPAVVTGFGAIGERQVLIVGQNRGRSLEERVACNFGCPHPEGYRKSLAKMKLAAKFGIPIVSLIDTPGAFPGTGAEERGVAMAIADNLRAMPMLPVPVVSVVIGEGGSGGALGIGVADRMAMFEHSIFSVISPEGCAAILWKTSTQAKSAAAALKLRAGDLLELGVIDEIIPEPLGGAHRNHAAAAAALERFVVKALDELTSLPIDTLLERRFDRLRTMGASFQEGRATRHIA